MRIIVSLSYSIWYWGIFDKKFRRMFKTGIRNTDTDTDTDTEESLF